MGIKEFSLKTTIFIALPALLLYTRSCIQDMTARRQAACRDCLRALHAARLASVTVIGPTDPTDPNENILQKRIADAATLRRLLGVVAALRAERVDVGEYKSSPLYKLALTHGTHTCDIYLSRGRLGRDIVSSALDSEYVDQARRFYPFIDSLFRHTPGGQPL